MRFSDSTVVIPTLNEAPNVRLLLRKLNALYPGVHILVADDGSTDGTKEIVRASGKNSRIRLIDRTKKKTHGLTVSVMDAVCVARTKYFVVMDSDFQHPPEKAGELIACLRKGAGVAVACRSSVPGWSLQRQVMSLCASFLAKAVLFLRGRRFPPDARSGFFGMRTSLARKILRENWDRFEPRGYNTMFDFLKSAPASIKLAAVPYVFGSRKYARSKLGLKHILLFLRSLSR